ncbi:transposase [Mesorhizobium japonicum MAFF 303099]|uniref:Transposase n=1 Tax=Mesorhizobium japonicum (strain LMG 29417 / CECT 9101 / MAFF 303099) TaxID=266835 RepID=Q989K9_RHILO|nr:transposase [Mesorhizobium japonicum MAFF 303099]
MIMDNLGSHKGKAMRRAIRGVGARLLLLPKYSPDLNPIEQALPSSSTGSERRRAEPSILSAARSAKSSMASPQPNATTTSKTPDLFNLKSSCSRVHNSMTGSWGTCGPLACGELGGVTDTRTLRPGSA